MVCSFWPKAADDGSYLEQVLRLPPDTYELGIGVGCSPMPSDRNCTEGEICCPKPVRFTVLAGGQTEVTVSAIPVGTLDVKVMGHEDLEGWQLVARKRGTSDDVPLRGFTVPQESISSCGGSRRGLRCGKHARGEDVLEEGAWTLRLSVPGCLQATQAVQVASGRATPVTFWIHRDRKPASYR